MNRPRLTALLPAAPLAAAPLAVTSFIVVMMMAVFVLTVAVPPAAAGHDHPIEQVSCDYRDAVKELERCVRQIRGFDRQDERLADDLEDASGRLRSAARRLDRPERLLKAWSEVSFYHREAEAHFIANPYRGPEAYQLIQIWDRADYLYSQLAQMMRGLSAQCSGHLGAGQFSSGYASPGYGSIGYVSPRPISTQVRHRGYSNLPYTPPASLQRAYRESELRYRRRSIGGIEVGANLSRRFD